MPLYDFRCATCGPFEERRSIAESSGTATCVACGADAVRVYRSPAIGGQRSATGLADAVDDRSRHDPARVVGVPGHGSGGHGHGHDHGPSRPWQIAH
ncbi:zinc ribbon domain-containing protein [Patulibacter sp.]|uniref:FmdB family zinc ribbon protein n=1 Tax=Patulibacter sp. TaxID=1912859 RepID=UPI0027265F0F|nr:zinc ribbon domain-containing protein [Patulibacter sp.]MDO9407826.1 zinc ribbon domain-containing protein [Patulibacter sp.]